MNELAKIFKKMNIDTQDVLTTADTKWNFLPFKPCLVGSHCIGVDPYYLTQAAQRTRYNSEIILASRRLNDGMGEYVVDVTVHDPWAYPAITKHEYVIELHNNLS